MTVWSMQCSNCDQRLEAERAEPWGFPSAPAHKTKEGADCSGGNQQGIAYRPVRKPG